MINVLDCRVEGHLRFHLPEEDLDDVVGATGLEYSCIEEEVLVLPRQFCPARRSIDQQPCRRLVADPLGEGGGRSDFPVRTVVRSHSPRADELHLPALERPRADAGETSPADRPRPGRRQVERCSNPAVVSLHRLDDLAEFGGRELEEAELDREVTSFTPTSRSRSSAKRRKCENSCQLGRIRQCARDTVCRGAAA